jgi:hypothetical protein
MQERVPVSRALDRNGWSPAWAFAAVSLQRLMALSFTASPFDYGFAANPEKLNRTRPSRVTRIHAYRRPKH